MKTTYKIFSIFFWISFNASIETYGSDSKNHLDDVTVEEHLSFAEMLAKAEQGCIAYQNQIGYFYLEGIGILKDYCKAKKWLQKAADEKYAAAQYNLGAIYYGGYGVNVDYPKAFLLFSDAANQDFALAQTALGFIHRSQMIAEEYSLSKAFNWFQKAASQGDPVAQYELAEAYLYGRGISQNITKAFKIYRILLKQNFPLASYRVARLYETGGFIEQNDIKATKFYRYFLKQTQNSTLSEYDRQEMTRRINYAKYFISKDLLKDRKRKREEPNNDLLTEDNTGEEIFPGASKNKRLRETQD